MTMTHSITQERLEHWQAAVIDGRRTVADIERRATYPAHPEPDTVALAEHYRLRWHQARILKVLSYFVSVTPDEIADLTGVHRALVNSEVSHLARRAQIRMESVKAASGRIGVWRLAHAADRDELRAVIQSAWEFEGEKSAA